MQIKSLIKAVCNQAIVSMVNDESWATSNATDYVRN